MTNDYCLFITKQIVTDAAPFITVVYLHPSCIRCGSIHQSNCKVCGVCVCVCVRERELVCVCVCVKES